MRGDETPEGWGDDDWIECWQCAGVGMTPGCFEDCCSGADCDPEDAEYCCCPSKCDVCRGEGSWPYKVVEAAT